MSKGYLVSLVVVLVVLVIYLWEKTQWTQGGPIETLSVGKRDCSIIGCVNEATQFATAPEPVALKPGEVPNSYDWQVCNEHAGDAFDRSQVDALRSSHRMSCGVGGSRAGRLRG